MLGEDEKRIVGDEVKKLGSSSGHNLKSSDQSEVLKGFGVDGGR